MNITYLLTGVWFLINGFNALTDKVLSSGEQDLLNALTLAVGIAWLIAAFASTSISLRRRNND